MDSTPDQDLETPVTGTTSRRSLLKGAGAAAGGLAALGALGAVATSGATAAGATPGPDVTYPGAPSMALYLKANGVQINGDYSPPNTDGGGAIECIYFEQKMEQKLSSTTGAAAGKRQFNPIIIRKKIDSATPLIHGVLASNKIMEATIKFFRGNADGQFNFYTVAIKGGRIGSIDDYSPDNQTEAAVNNSFVEPMQEISISFNTITWSFGDTSVTDSLSAKF